MTSQARAVQRMEKSAMRRRNLDKREAREREVAVQRADLTAVKALRHFDPRPLAPLAFTWCARERCCGVTASVREGGELPACPVCGAERMGRPS